MPDRPFMVSQGLSFVRTIGSRLKNLVFDTIAWSSPCYDFSDVHLRQTQRMRAVKSRQWLSQLLQQLDVPMKDTRFKSEIIKSRLSALLFGHWFEGDPTERIKDVRACFEA